MGCCASKEHIYNYTCIIEGSFSLSVRDIDKDTKKGKVLYVFSIVLHKKDESLLISIQSTLGIGKIYAQWKKRSTIPCGI